MADMSRSRLAALAAATLLVLPACGTADEFSDPSPVSRPTTSAATSATGSANGSGGESTAPTSDTAPGDLLPSGTDGEGERGTEGEDGIGTGTDGGTGSEAAETQETSTEETSDQGEGPELGAPGIPACDVLELPATTLPVIEDIEAGGPYDYPRNDGVRFQNREGILPDEDRDYYREFTVETPGLDHRGARRIVTGGFEETDPEHWYFTGDHYESFCEFDPDQLTSP